MIIYNDQYADEEKPIDMEEEKDVCYDCGGVLSDEIEMDEDYETRLCLDCNVRNYMIWKQYSK